MEVRVDREGVRHDKTSDIIEWIARDQHVTDPGQHAVRGLYWAPYFGAPNDGGVISSTAALGALEIMLRSATESGGLRNTRVFLEQFNFNDNTPGMDQNSVVAPGDQIDFLLGAGQLLKDLSRGYALWAYRNYRQSIIYNGFYERNLDGWGVEDCCATARGDPGTNHVLELAPATATGIASVRQTVESSSGNKCFDGKDATRPVTACVLLSGTGRLSLKVNERIAATWQATPLWNEVCASLEARDFWKPALITLEATASSVSLDNFELYCHEHHLGVVAKASVENAATPAAAYRADYVHEAIVQLNAGIAKRRIELPAWKRQGNLQDNFEHILFQHIPKIGGTTLRVELASHAKDNNISMGAAYCHNDVVVRDTPCDWSVDLGNRFGRWFDLEGFSAREPQQIAYGHGVAWGIHKFDPNIPFAGNRWPARTPSFHSLPSKSFVYITWMREPTRWALGRYRLAVRSGTNATLREWILEDKAIMEYNKYIFLPFSNDVHHISETAMAAFKEAMTQHFVVLIFESMDRSLDLLQHLMGYPHLSMDRPQHVSGDASTSARNHEHHAKEDILLITQRLRDTGRAYAFGKALFNEHLRVCGFDLEYD
jgi:hypothetical protein